MELTGNEHMITTKYLVFPEAELLSPKDNKNSAAPNNDLTYKDDIFSIIISLKTGRIIISFFDDTGPQDWIFTYLVKTIDWVSKN